MVHSKTQIPTLIKDFIAYVENQFDTSIKIIRSDNGTKIFQEACSSLFASKGIIHQRSLPGKPQQNGRVERKHKHLLETVRALKFHVALPNRFWGECLLASTYLINLMPSSVLQWLTPYECLMKKPPSYDHLKVIGCLCYASCKSSDTFAPRAKKCVFLGYPYGQKGYKLYDLQSHKIILSRDVKFQEDIFPFKASSSSQTDSYSPSTSMINPALHDDDIPHFFSTTFSTSSTSPIHTSSLISLDSPTAQSSSSLDSLSQPSTDIVLQSSSTQVTEPVCSPIRRSSRQPIPSTKYTDFVLSKPLIPPSTSSNSSSFNVFQCPELSSLPTDYLASLANVLSTVEPSSYAQAKADPRWVDAMNKELEALEKNGTWDIVDLPSDVKPIGCKYVYKTKFNPDGTV